MAAVAERMEMGTVPARSPDATQRGDDTREAPGRRLADGSDASSTRRERLDTIGWGLVFVLVGTLALPDSDTKYALVAGVGVLMLGLNAALLAIDHRFDLVTVVLGATALIAGSGALAGLRVDAFALFFLLLGFLMVLVPVIRMIRGRA